MLKCLWYILKGRILWPKHVGFLILILICITDILTCSFLKCELWIFFNYVHELVMNLKVFPSLTVIQSCVPLILSFSVAHSASGIIINYSIFQKCNLNSLFQALVYSISTFSRHNFWISPLFFNVSAKSVIHYFLGDNQFVSFLVHNYLVRT
jgi:hypothetical protein